MDSIDPGTPYADAVAWNAGQDLLHLNMPGHSADRGAGPQLMDFYGADILKKDITPMLGGVDLGPDNPYTRSLPLAVEAWGARQSWFLTNRASRANRIGALVFGSLGRYDQPILVQRSAHSSFIDGIIMAGLLPVFMEPIIGESFGIAHGIAPAMLERALAKTDDPKGVYVVTPSYFGAVADVSALADIAHAAGVPLMVDEAWGAHTSASTRGCLRMRCLSEPTLLSRVPTNSVAASPSLQCCTSVMGLSPTCSGRWSSERTCSLRQTLW